VEHPSPDIRELADSIRELGVMDPLHVERLPSGRFLLIAGARRRRAALLVGLTEVPVIVYVSVPQALRTALQLAENLKRKSLTPAELKAGYRRLIEELEGDVPAAARLLALTPRRLYQVLSGKPQTPKVPATPNSIARQLHRFADASSELDTEARATLLEAAQTLVKKLEGKRSRSSSG
jgi:ParB-like chromosome segregation protein Spo0J